MDRLRPLLDLRREWRAAALTTLPTAGGVTAQALDYVLDKLVRRGQLSEDDLNRGLAAVVAKVRARSDRRDTLEQLLRRAVRDYVAVAASAGSLDVTGAAFATDTALADALRQMAVEE